jgi:hypothetical protein
LIGPGPVQGKRSQLDQKHVPCGSLMRAQGGKTIDLIPRKAGEKTGKAHPTGWQTLKQRLCQKVPVRLAHLRTFISPLLS